MEKHKKKVALVTGATQFTGFTVAKYFAMQGYDVCVTSRTLEKAEDAAQRLKVEVPDSEFFPVGMVPSDVEETRKAFKQVKEHFGRLDCFIANACAACRFQSILSTDEETYDFVMNSNAKGYFFGTQEAAKLMIEEKISGSIVLIGSVHSRGALPNRLPYAMSKSAIETLGKNAAYELGKYGIRVNTLIAGAITNDKFIEQSEEEKNKRREAWPLGRESYPEDIAKAVYFLASENASTITGTSLVVDSGVTACLLKYEKNWETIG